MDVETLSYYMCLRCIILKLMSNWDKDKKNCLKS